MAYLIYTWLSAHGCHHPCVAALLGNAHAEVGETLNPCTVDGAFIGLFQWGYERKTALLNKYGKQWCKLEHQLSFMVSEMQARGVWVKLTTTKSLQTAAAIVADFEGGKGPEVRYHFALSYSQQIKRFHPPAIQWSWK